MKIWQRKIVNTNRGSFEIFIKGSGKPLCVTHLYSIFNHSGDYFADSFTCSFQVYLINLRETGSSVKAIEPYQLSMLETVFDLEAIREALGLSSWTFAGHSTGGMLGAVYGIFCSKSLDQLLLVGAAARDYFTFSSSCIYHQEHPKFQEMQQLNIQLKQKHLSPKERKKSKIKRIKLSLHQPDKYKTYFSKEINKGLSAARMDYFNREIQLFDITKKLKLISTSTLIVCGRFDVQCPLEYSEEMHEKIPQSTLIIFENSNHYPFLEEATRFTEEVVHRLSHAD
ncbi:alpha/beta hydrolase [Bacillus spongiae]|uniref:Alpha/beta hydrolase n=1 Tax=Bacillus spongiae TaxID=2683610 RepID=A0ABU8HC16_9BACI